MACPSRMPALTAATNFCTGGARRAFSLTSFRPASASGTGPGDCGCACSSIGLQHVAIDLDRARPEFFEIDNRSQRAANQTLNLYAATVDATFCNVARLSRLRRIGKHRILSCQPTTGHSLLFHPA